MFIDGRLISGREHKNDRRCSVDDAETELYSGFKGNKNLGRRGQAMSHYIGLDVGTGSVRACLIDEKGDILVVATKDIKTWHEKADYYVYSLGTAG